MASGKTDPLASPEKRRFTGTARTRVVIALMLGCCLGVIGLAVVRQPPHQPGLEFSQSGHWVYSTGHESALHVDGATGQVDAQANVPGASEGSQVVQGDGSGFVVDRSKITEFSKSTLSVQGSANPPAPEAPASLEVAGGPYLVYRNAGQVVRLGDPTATVAAGGPVTGPVATSDGTVWLLRSDNGAVCELPKITTQLTCPARLAPGHTGQLTVIGDQPVVVDLTNGVMQRASADGLGTAVPLGFQLPGTVQVAAGAVDGRLAILDPTQRDLMLIDTAGLDGRPAAVPVTVKLPSDGTFTGLVAVSHTVTTVDQTSHEVLTFDSKGQPTGTAPVPGSAGPPRLTAGQDDRIYVDSPDGSHVLVVNGHNGSLVDVNVNDRAPSAPTAEQAAGQPAEQPPGRAPARSTTAPPPILHQAADAPVVDASVDSSGQLNVTWTAPNLHGANLVHYQVSVAGQDDRVVTGNSTSYQGLSGTVNITVRAITRYGSAGDLLTGSAGGRQVTTGPTAAATVEILNVSSSPSGLVVTVDADGKGGQATCQANFLGATSAWVPCSGTTQITIPNTYWFGVITVTATAQNSVGSGTNSWTGSPNAYSGSVLWFGPVLLAGMRRRNKKAGNEKGTL